MDSDVPLPHEPRPASTLRRVLGWLLDYVIVVIPGIGLVLLAGASLIHSMPGYIGSVAAEFGWSQLIRLFTHQGAGAGALGAAASKEWLAFAAPLIGALLLVPLVQFLYQATLLAWRGRTIGKMLAGTRIAVPDASRRRDRGAVRRALGTTVLETGLLSIALVAIVVGQFSIGMLIWAAAVVAFWINALAVLGPRRRTVIDRLSGTKVVRSTLYAEVTERTVELALRTSGAAVEAGQKTSETAVAAGRKGSDMAITAGRKTSETAVAAGRITSDAAVVAGQLAREGADALIGSAPVQQVLNSRAGQQAQALSAAGADRARQLGGQAAGRALQLGGRAQQVWKERQAKRGQQKDEPKELTDQGEA